MNFGIRCERCGDIFESRLKACPNCGHLNTQMQSAAFGWLRGLNAAGVFNLILWANITFFAVSLLVSVLVGGLSSSLWVLPAPNAFSLQILGWASSSNWQSTPQNLLIAIFLHGGVLHIGFNMFALRDLMRLSPMFFSVQKCWIAYVLSGVVGNLVAVVFTHSAVVGASGAITGLAGTLIAVGFAGRDIRQRMIVMQLSKWLVLLFIFGMLVPNISNAAHIGGFCCGYLCGRLYSQNRLTPQLLDTLTLASGGLCLLCFGLSAHSLLDTLFL